jgi:hypothetical protein
MLESSGNKGLSTSVKSEKDKAVYGRRVTLKNENLNTFWCPIISQGAD